MLVIQIPIVFFIGGLAGFFAGLYGLLKIVGWHYQTKAMRMLAQRRPGVPVDRAQAWDMVKQLHKGVENDEM